MDDDELCECGHDRAAHHPALNCSLCDCSVPVTPELRLALDFLARQPLHIRLMVVDTIRSGWMSERDDLLDGPARDAHIAALRQKLAELLERTHLVVDGQDMFRFDDDDRRELAALKTELDAYEARLHN